MISRPTILSDWSRESLLVGRGLPVENMKKIGKRRGKRGEAPFPPQPIEADLVGNLRIVVCKDPSGARSLRLEIEDDDGHCLCWTETPTLFEGDSVTVTGWKTSAHLRIA